MPPVPYKRTAHRWRLGAVIGLFLFLAGGSFYLMQLMLAGEADLHPDLRNNDPDYIIDNFHVVRMSPQGKPRYIMSGEKLMHRPVDDVSMIDKPVLRSITDDAPPMNVTALRAHLAHSQNKIDLLGEVDIERDASPTSKKLSIKTNALTILPDEDRMDTPLPVDMTIGTAVMQGAGLHIDNARRTLRTDGKGTLTIQSK